MIRVAVCLVVLAALLPGKVTVGTAAPVIAAGTEILVNLDSFLHPKRSIKAGSSKIKRTFTRKPAPPPNPVTVPVPPTPEVK